MRITRRALPISISAVGVAGWGTGTSAGTALRQTVIAEQHVLDFKLLEAHRLKDTAAVLNCFSRSPDAFFISPGGSLNKGKQAIRKIYDNFFSGLETIRGEVQEVAYQPAGDGVIAVGTVIFYRKPRGAASDQKTVIWTDYRQKEDGKWVYLFRHAHWPLQHSVLGS